jgi:hypothetical protein
MSVPDFPPIQPHQASTPNAPTQQTALPPSTTSNWESKAEEYLLFWGWEKVGTNERGIGIWADPKGNVPQVSEYKDAIQLPVVGGGFETIKQWFGPPVAWNYSTEEALSIQKQREKAGETIAQAIIRKEEELAALRAKDKDNIAKATAAAAKKVITNSKELAEARKGTN